MFLRQEDHADAVFAGRRQHHTLDRHLGAVIVVGDLDQDAGAVAHQLVGAHRTAVIQVLQDLQTLLDDVVRARTLDVGDEADAAGIVLVARVVQAAGGECLDLFGGRGGQGGVGHGALQAERGWGNLSQRSNPINSN